MVFLWQHQSASKIIVTSCACLVPKLMPSSGLRTMLGRWVRANQSFRPSLLCVQNSPLFHLKTGLAALLPPCASAPIVRAIKTKLTIINQLYINLMTSHFFLVKSPISWSFRHLSERRFAGIPHGTHQEGPLQGLQLNRFGLRNHPQVLTTTEPRCQGFSPWRFCLEKYGSYVCFAGFKR